MLKPDKPDPQNKNMLEMPLFNADNDGQLVEYYEQEYDRMQITCFKDNTMVLGRHQEVFQLIKFCSNEESTSYKILALNGQRGQGCTSMARFAIKYAMDRHKVIDGAFSIDMEGKSSAQCILNSICKKFGLHTKDIEEVTSSIRKKSILILITKCQKIIEENFDKLKEIVLTLVQECENLKIILTTNMEKNLQFETNFVYQIKMQPLEKMYAVIMMFQKCSQNEKFIAQYKSPDELGKCKIFNNKFELTP